MLNITVMLSLVIVTFLGCSNESGTAQAGDQASAPETGEDKADARGEDLDCDTLVTEVRQACANRYAKGLLVECAHFASTVSMSTIANRATYDPNSTKTKVAAKLCSRYGKELREAVTGAKTQPAAPACVELGKHLEESCFRFIGETTYNSTQCRHWLASSRSLTEEACTVTEQLAGMLQGH